MNMTFLILGTVILILFLIFLFKGKKYTYMLETLSGDDFPLKSIYCAGLSLQEIKLFKPKGDLGSMLRKKAKLIYTPKYAEYYVTIIWAQSLSMGMLMCGICFTLAAIVKDMTLLLGVLGVVMIIMPGYIFINNLSDKVIQRQEACEKAFPDAISKLALIVNSGVILREAWEIVANGNDGELYKMMQKSCVDMQNGVSEIDAIVNFGYLTNSDDIKKFTSALAQSIERGGGELPSFLRNQSKELWAHKRQVMLQKGEKAAGALLMPIGLMFAGVMLIVIAAAVQSFSL